VQQLMSRARAVADHAYAPYSHFRVGAAVQDASGAIFVGCNVENASYGLTVCAERNAIFAAVASGAVHPFSALAVTCPDGACSPCGACRQVMAEHLSADAPVHVDNVGAFTVAQLLPYGFTLKR
jgi:cytidine deaminase